MKKQFLLCTVLLSGTVIAWAQKPDTAQVLVHYKFSHVRDTTNREHPYTENMILIVGKNAGAYKSYDKRLQDALFKKQVQEQEANSVDGHVNIQRRSSGSGTEYYQFPNGKKMVRKEPLLFNNYLITDALPAIDWKISSDTATFGGLHCQKATTHFKGRDYTAWFSPDLPLHIGPWKLNGLPGVIVEAYDTKKEVDFKFDGIEKAIIFTKKGDRPANQASDSQGRMAVMIGMDDEDSDPNIIQLPTKAIRTTEKEFVNLQEAMRKDPNAFAQSMINAHSASQGDGRPAPKIDIKIGPPQVINNQIELPEKK
ncbi:GLPGLI family protein [Mucilaginibacter sp. OK268]|uniref:GLPGLI family protein n=1 Tax=Mucilaginibacter sp. OK268 TaxID=1881048 RepID=UPI00088420E0|nr:GLPGLI family protein [Mucilaginibacter sp. OK268]SDP20981.1 GLPGLI family protein [Mucilaginibacter sp. OK268]